MYAGDELHGDDVTSGPLSEEDDRADDPGCTDCGALPGEPHRRTPCPDPSYDTDWNPDV